MNYLAIVFAVLWIITLCFLVKEQERNLELRGIIHKHIFDWASKYDEDGISGIEL